MISAQYIPLSVRVKNWSLTLFSKDDLLSLLEGDAETAMVRIIRKEGIKQPAQSPLELLKYLREQLVSYGLTAAGTLSGEGRTFVRELMREFEISNLKNLVRMILSGRFEDIFYNYVFSPELSLHRYREIRTFSELRRWLEHSFYRGIIGSLDRVESEGNSVYWESALDTLYSNRIAVVAKRLDTKGKMGAKRLILMPLHLERLLLVYRHRFHYGALPEDTYVNIPNATHMCSMDLWKQFVSAPTSSGFHALMKEKNYIDASTGEDASQIYRGVTKKIEALCRREFYGSLTSIASFLAFYQLKKVQITRLSTILEAKSLLVRREDVLQYL